MIVGAFRSTLFPGTGPAGAQFPATSQIDRLAVDAFDVSVPTGTAVVSVKFTPAVLTKPEPVSLLVQAIETLSECQAPSDEPHETTGRERSTFKPRNGPTWAQLPTRSQTGREPVDASASADPSDTAVVRSKAAAVGSARPEP